jgi:hypothetical protein
MNGAKRHESLSDTSCGFDFVQFDFIAISILGGFVLGLDTRAVKSNSNWRRCKIYFVDLRVILGDRKPHGMR